MKGTMVFDDFRDRTEHNSAKWKSAYRHYQKNIIPMSVADMDFPAPSILIENLSKVNKVGIYGYTILPSDYYKIVRDFIYRHYKYDVNNEDIIFCPRIIQAISIYIREFTSSNDGICIFTPSYSPVLNAITLNGRKVNYCKLLNKENSYHINFNELEQCFKLSKAFILISPHNPTGIVWSKTDLYKIAKLAEKYNVFIISDDVHADFNFSEQKHIVISSLNKYVENNSIICTSPAKTFNIPGLEISNLIICNKYIREKFIHCMQSLGMHNPNFFSVPAINIAYQFCDEWLEELKEYILKNKILVREFFKKEIPELRIVDSQGTYLLWVNYQDLNINEDILKHWFIDLSGIEVSWGSDFGIGGLNFFRMNVAMPRFLLKRCLIKIKDGLKLLRQEEIDYDYKFTN